VPLAGADALGVRLVELIDLYVGTAEPVAELATDNGALHFMQCDASES